MFCKSCGNKIEDNAKFCGYCGAKNISNLSSLGEEKESINGPYPDKVLNETVEEYQSRTNIKSKEEAAMYLGKLKKLFWGVFLGGIPIRILDSFLRESSADVLGSIFIVLFIAYLGLSIYFVVFSVKVLKAEKLSPLNAAWCIFFAPISWLYLYPLITDPLKIILGKKQPPKRK